MVDTCGIEPPGFVCTDDDLDPSIVEVDSFHFEAYTASRA